MLRPPRLRLWGSRWVVNSRYYLLPAQIVERHIGWSSGTDGHLVALHAQHRDLDAVATGCLDYDGFRRFGG
jgi:hypothetical protein